MPDFPPQLPHGELSEVLPGFFFVAGQSRPDFGGNTLQFSRNMVVIRDGKDLTLVNTMRQDEAGLAQLDALGTVRNIVRLGGFHGRDDAFYTDRYDAAMWALPGTPHERGVTSDKDLSTNGDTPFPDGSVFAFETASTPEAILRLDRSGGVLVSCDSLQNWAGPDDWFDEPSTAMMQEMGFFRPANVGPGWRNSAKPEASDFARLMEMEFSHLLSAHGDPLLNTAKAAVGATLKDLYGV